MSSEMYCKVLIGAERKNLEGVIKSRHYTHSVPSGKSYYCVTGFHPSIYEAIVVWSIPANKNIAKFVLGWQGKVWELSRLWAPDGHAKNILSQSISEAVKVIRKAENPDALVSYADPNAGHKGGVYRAASWIYHGQSEEGRYYVNAAGQTFSRRAFHSGSTGMKKAQIEALGFKELKMPGKERFVKPLSRRARRALTVRDEP